MDVTRLFKICLVHDLGEAIGGDIPAPEQARQLAKALDKLETIMQHTQGPIRPASTIDSTSAMAANTRRATRCSPQCAPFSTSPRSSARGTFDVKRAPHESGYKLVG